MDPQDTVAEYLRQLLKNPKMTHDQIVEEVRKLVKQAIELVLSLEKNKD